jgi:ubiquinone/menaquinone biosynthesis C-methylase UbiE
MDQESYEYKGLMATAWDLLRGDTSNWEDRFFYRDLIIRYGQPVLDVGCGTGRLLLDSLAQGIAIDGVDVSPDMLAICAEKAQLSGLHPGRSSKSCRGSIYPAPIAR